MAVITTLDPADSYTVLEPRRVSEQGSGEVNADVEELVSGIW